MFKSKWLLLLMLLALVLVVGCSDDEKQEEDTDNKPEVNHLDSIPDWQKQRQLDYLKFACDKPLSTGSMNHLMAHLECEKRLPDFKVEEGIVPTDAWDKTFDKMWQLKDTSDFSMNSIINLLYSFRGHKAVPEELWKKLEKSVLDFKYWYTDKTPERIVDGEQVVDMMWYWSENHIFIFKVNEYLAGKMFPDEKFAVTGMTGREHMERAKKEMVKWLDERSKWGFTEWHSNVYYNWDMKPLLTLIEWSDDKELVEPAKMVLDLFWLDMALHLHKGTFGATHGRSYIKDKPAAELEDAFDGAKLLFEDTDLPFHSTTSGVAIYLARTEKYQLPYIIRTIAKYEKAMVDRERMNLPVDEKAPENYDDPVADPPYGLNYTEEHLPLWWSMAGFLAWPLLPLTFEASKKYNLWDGPFEVVSMISNFIDLNQPIEKIMKDVHAFYKPYWRIITSGLLKEVYTYTYRTDDYMLSSALDYRAGSIASQVHPWQATLSEHAMVFTQQPGYLPVEEGEEIPEDWNWQKKDEPGPGYWTGEGSLPKVGQFENVGVIIYAPQFEPKPLGLDMFNYRDETHAYFPQVHFDEVIQNKNWTCGSKDNAYVGLYSYRDVKWRTGQPEVFKNGDKPFDLVADGVDNVWIVEMGDKNSSESLDAFCSSLASAKISISEVADQDDDGYKDGYDVEYESPSKGTVSFGWHKPLKVKGDKVPLKWKWRFDNPFVQTEFNTNIYNVVNGEHNLKLDFTKASREASEAAK